MKNKNNLDELILTFTNTGKLPTKYITCTKCSTEVTAFGTNLEGKIKKFGTLFKLLTTFECRKCTSASKPKKEKKISIRITKRMKKEEKKNQPIPQVKQFVPRNVLLKDAPDIIESYTAFSCGAPNLYLDNGKACHGCAFWNSCKCSLRNVNEFAVAA